MDNNVNKDWNQPGTWAEEMVEQAKADKKRWMIAFFVVLALFFGTNAYWIYQFTNYEYVSQDGSGNNNINTGNQEDITFGSEDED